MHPHQNNFIYLHNFFVMNIGVFNQANQFIQVNLLFDGADGECTRIAFRPNPAFSPSTYDERIVHGLGGFILIHEPDDRLCGIQGHLIDRVTFGYGILGRLDKDSHFAVTRVPVTATDWKSTRIDVHLDGRILLLKSISRDEEAVHSGHEPLPPNLSLAEAATLTRP